MVREKKIARNHMYESRFKAIFILIFHFFQPYFSATRDVSSCHLHTGAEVRGDELDPFVGEELFRVLFFMAMRIP